MIAPGRGQRLALAHDNESAGVADIQLVARLNPGHFPDGFRDHRLAFD